MSESDLEAVDSKRQSSHDKHRGERGVVVRVRRERERERESEERGGMKGPMPPLR
jgi:hypothetical protein